MGSIGNFPIKNATHPPPNLPLEGGGENRTLYLFHPAGDVAMQRSRRPGVTVGVLRQAVDIDPVRLAVINHAEAVGNDDVPFP